MWEVRLDDCGRPYMYEPNDRIRPMVGWVQDKQGLLLYRKSLEIYAQILSNRLQEVAALVVKVDQELEKLGGYTV